MISAHMLLSVNRISVNRQTRYDGRLTGISRIVFTGNFRLDRTLSLFCPNVSCIYFLNSLDSPLGIYF